MKLVDFVLSPAGLLLLAAVAAMAGAAFFENYSRSGKHGPDGIVLGLFVFASAALIAAVIRQGKIREGD